METRDASTALTPRAAAERFEFVDGLRGFALWAILLPLFVRTPAPLAARDSHSGGDRSLALYLLQTVAGIWIFYGFARGPAEWVWRGSRITAV